MGDTAIPAGPGKLLPAVIGSTLAGSALVIAPGLLFYYDITPKVALILLGTAALLFLHRRWTPGLRALVIAPPSRLLLAALALNAVSLTLSTVVAGDPALAWTGSEWRRMGLPVEIALLLWAGALASWAAGAPQRIVATLRGITVAGLAGSVYGIFQYFGADPLLRTSQYTIGEGYWAIVRPPGSLGHAGYFAAFLLSGVFACVAVARLDGSRTWRTLGLLCAFLCSTTVVLSGTRSAIIGLAAGGAALGYWFRPGFRSRHFALLAGLAATAAAFYFSPPGQKLRARTRWYIEDSAGGGRLPLWRDAARMGGANWPAGAGLENFSAAFLPFQSLDLTLVFPDRYYESPHNIALDAWTAQGLPGLAAFAALLAAAFLASCKSLGTEDRPLMGCLAAALITLCASGLFLSFVAVTKLYFYSQISLIVALSASDTSDPGVLPQRQSRGWFDAAAIAAGLGFAVLAVALLRADYALQKVRAAVIAREPSRIIDLYERFQAIRPAGMYTDLWFSREMYLAAFAEPKAERRRELWRAGKEAALRAAQRSETPQSAAYSLAMFHAEDGNPQAVEENLRAAASKAPNWYKPYWMLAQVLEASGRREEAVEPARRAWELSGNRIDEVRATWERLKPAPNLPAASRKNP